ncbi:Enoyl-CoA hydratase AKT3-1 [Penicillium longicatenatum]|nr:Enoyl-CoA hydratase AKT3-1 [Penicillium longicatenatum]
MTSIDTPTSYESLNLTHIKITHHPCGAPEATPVVVFTLDRPEKHNAFTPQMADSLTQAYKMIHVDPRVKVVVLTGAGRMFCAGSDLGIGFGSGHGRAVDFRDMYVREHEPQQLEIIANAIAGSQWRSSRASNASMPQAYYCRFEWICCRGWHDHDPASRYSSRICHEKSKYGFVFTRRGLTIESCASYFLPRLVGFARAMHLITTGGVFPPTPQHFGDLFTEVLPDAGKILPRGLELAQEIAENVSPLASSMSRALMWEGADSPEAAHLLESRMFHHMIGQRDYREGVHSFLEKRKPRFESDLRETSPPNYPWWPEVDITREATVSKHSKL